MIKDPTKLSEEIQYLLFSSEGVEKISQIAAGFAFTPEQFEAFAIEIKAVLTGEKRYRELAANISLACGISIERAGVVVNQLEIHLFKDILNELDEEPTSEDRDSLLDEIENPTSHRDLYPFTEPMDELLPAPESPTLITNKVQPAEKTPVNTAAPRSVTINKPKAVTPGLESVSTNLNKDTLGNTKPKSYTNDPYREPIE